MKQCTGSVEKIKDPNGRRYGFKSFVYDEKTLNDLVNRMLREGYEPNPKIELV